MILAEYNTGYDIRDVDGAFRKFIESFGFQVYQDGGYKRVPIYFGDDVEEVAFRLPSIYVYPGSSLRTPLSWQKDPGIEFNIDEEDDTLINTTLKRFTEVFYSYRVSFYLGFKQHTNEAEQLILSRVPNKFVLSFMKDNKSFKLGFVRDAEIFRMDDVEDDKRIYRRDFIVTTQLLFMTETITTDLRALEVVVSTTTLKEE